MDLPSYGIHVPSNYGAEEQDAYYAGEEYARLAILAHSEPFAFSMTLKHLPERTADSLLADVGRAANYTCVRDEGGVVVLVAAKSTDFDAWAKFTTDLSQSDIEHDVFLWITPAIRQRAEEELRVLQLNYSVEDMRTGRYRVLIPGGQNCPTFVNWRTFVDRWAKRDVTKRFSYHFNSANLGRLRLFLRDSGVEYKIAMGTWSSVLEVQPTSA